MFDTRLYHKAREESTLLQVKALANDIALPKLVKFLPEEFLVQHMDGHYPSRLIKQTIAFKAMKAELTAAKKKKAVCRYWARGVCRNLRCRFAHGEHER